MKSFISNSIAMLLMLALFSTSCTGVSDKGEPIPPEGGGVLKAAAINLSSSASPITRHYNLEGLNANLLVPQYNLPLNLSGISNFSSFSEKISLSSNARDLLEANGFVVIRNPFDPSEEYITEPYSDLKPKEIPIFITADSLLHLYHIQFDETLRKVEEQEFYDAIWEISKSLLTFAANEYASTSDSNYKNALKTVQAYFAVGLELLKPKQGQVCEATFSTAECTYPVELFAEGEGTKSTFQTPALVKNVVDEELALISAHQGFSTSPIFSYNEDFSQYVPRGHYTRSEKLKNYFNAMMWFGRMGFILKGCQTGCIVSESKAEELTRAALIISNQLNENSNLLDKWRRIYTVTSFYVGTSDDLGPPQYIEAINDVFGGSLNPGEMDAANLGEIKSELAALEGPKIYGGTGACVISPPYTPEQADECLNNTAGFRLMGQRFVPDSYMFSNLVGSYTGRFEGSGNPFTAVSSPSGLIRGFPRGLDIMSILGSRRAKAILAELQDSSYELYPQAFDKLANEFDSLTYEDWNKNLYWSLLFTLKPFLKEFGAGYPTFMQTQAWQDKTLTTALSSWAELRHDTILYAKQSYGQITTAGPGGGVVIEPKRVVGYVEPVPEFYNRLLALIRMTIGGLSSMNVIDIESKTQLTKLATIIGRLKQMAIDELQNKELSEEDYDFIDDFGKELKSVIRDVDDKARKTTIVADVHTDGSTQQVLEEGLGYVDLVLVAYKVPDGRILIGAGPVMTYYEFKQPMANRLTDEEWRIKLNDNPPQRPKWVSNFYQ